MENQDKKRILIIDAALKRFAHYGLAKTTMSEIAKDISFSKALLYYYFPDKRSLYVSTMEHLMYKMGKDIVKSADKSSSSAEAISKLLQKRQSYIQKYYNLFESSQVIANDLPEDLFQKFEQAKTFVKTIITSILDNGNQRGELAVQDTALTAEIFSDALKGIHFNILARDKNIFPGPDQFKEIFHKEKIFSEIFMAGLTIR
ncbi:MAG: TetR/AcrR family transcriptional regulator [Pedobacter sp.]|nr:MAG: TetR/AcrR family transcriptional regulator [Pedobacter sp.]